MKTPVIFRMDGPDCVAVFPCEPATRDPHTIAIYAHLGQHGGAETNWYRSTRRAAEPEYRALLSELRAIGYSNLVIRQRMTHADYIRRVAEAKR